MLALKQLRCVRTKSDKNEGECYAPNCRFSPAMVNPGGAPQDLQPGGRSSTAGTHTPGGQWESGGMERMGFDLRAGERLTSALNGTVGCLMSGADRFMSFYYACTPYRTYPGSMVFEVMYEREIYLVASEVIDS